MCKEKIYFIMAICLFPFLLCAITRYVDDDYANPTEPYYSYIQDAINDFVIGDIIYVFNGTYNENLDTTDDGVIIRSEFYDSGDEIDIQNTIINSSYSGYPVVKFGPDNSGTGPIFEICGFTIEDADGAPGVEFSYTGVSLISDCIITNNYNPSSPSRAGGGIRCFHSTVSIENCVITNNVSYSGGGIQSTESEIVIENSQIFGNYVNHFGGAICGHKYNIYHTGTDNISIFNSLIYDNVAELQAGGLFLPGNYHFHPEYIIDHCIITGNSSNLPGTTNGISLGDTDYTHTLYITNSIIKEESPNILQPGNTHTHCYIYCSCITGGCDDIYAEIDVNTIFDDPLFIDESTDNYNLQWGSGCIDTGNYNSAEDADYSPADMGCYPYERDHFDMTRVTYKWLCYPRLDVSDDVNNGENDDYLYPDDAMDEFWNSLPNSVYIYDEDNDGPYPDYACYSTNSGGNLVWNPFDYEFYSYKGIKVQTNYQFYIGGYLMDEDYQFDEFPADQENWIGYYLEKSQRTVDAISSSVMEKILEIKTQRWSVNRDTTEDPLLIASKYTFNYGDCVILKLDEAVDGFQWQQGRDEIEPYIRPVAEHFDYNDELDYQPIYVEFDDELPLEIAVYVNDVCKGAQVVDDTLIQICAYIQEEEAGQEIEIVTYTGDRSFRKQEYLVLDNSNGEVKSEKLVTGIPGDFYRISCKADDQLPPAIRYNVHCTPNPFNPSTDICFSLDDPAEVKLSIYNIRGQLVDVLADEYFRKGEYRINWTGTDKTSKPVGSGVYFYRLISDKDIIDGKMLMLK